MLRVNRKPKTPKLYAVPMLCVGCVALAAGAARAQTGAPVHSQGATPAESQTAAQQLAAHQLQAQQDLRDHRPDLAAQEYRAIVDLDPGNADAHSNLGVLFFFQARYADAIPQLRAAIKLRPDLWRQQALLGVAERQTGDESHGRADLEAAFPHLDEPKLKIDTGRDLIDSYTSAGELGKAAAIASALLKIAPTDPGLLYTSYRLYSDLAGEAMLDLSLVAPESGQMHQAMAHELYRERDMSAAIANFRKAVAADPHLPGIHFELAEALHTSDEPKLRAEAAGEYKLALAQNPRDVKALTRLGDLATAANDFDAAAGYYKQALSLAPNDIDACLGMAYLDSERHDPSAALPLLQTAVASDPTNVLAHYRLSAVYRALHRPEDSRRELETYQKYKAIREKMRALYQQMRLDAPSQEDKQADK